MATIKSNTIQYKTPNYKITYHYVDPDAADIFKHVSNSLGQADHPRNQDAIEAIVAACGDKRDCIWDVGSNIGVMGVHLIRYFKHVVCFEPHPMIFQSCKQTMEDPANKVEGHTFSLHQVGVGDVAGVLHMQDYGPSQLRQILKAEEVGKKKASVEVPVVTGDSLLGKETVPDFIKIDVESYEWFVLQGMQRVIEQHRPSFMIEIEDEKFHRWGKDAKDVFDFFHQRDYVAQDKWGRTWKDRNDKTMWVSATRRGVRDFFFVPAHKQNNIKDNLEKVKNEMMGLAGSDLFAF